MRRSAWGAGSAPFGSFCAGPRPGADPDDLAVPDAELAAHDPPPRGVDGAAGDDKVEWFWHGASLVCLAPALSSGGRPARAGDIGLRVGVRRLGRRVRLGVVEDTGRACQQAEVTHRDL